MGEQELELLRRVRLAFYGPPTLLQCLVRPGGLYDLGHRHIAVVDVTSTFHRRWWGVVQHAVHVLGATREWRRENFHVSLDWYERWLVPPPQPMLPAESPPKRPPAAAADAPPPKRPPAAAADAPPPPPKRPPAAAADAPPRPVSTTKASLPPVPMPQRPPPRPPAADAAAAAASVLDRGAAAASLPPRAKPPPPGFPAAHTWDGDTPGAAAEDEWFDTPEPWIASERAAAASARREFEGHRNI